MFGKLKNIYNILYLRILFYLHGKNSMDFPVEATKEEVVPPRLFWWARQDSNLGPIHYECTALTN